MDLKQMETRATKAVSLLKVLANERRLMILCYLLSGEKSVSELNQRLEMSQSALSQHLAKMREEGLVTFRRESQTLCYRIDTPDVEKLMATLKAMFCP